MGTPPVCNMLYSQTREIDGYIHHQKNEIEYTQVVVFQEINLQLAGF